jgi:uncharacterized membrane protein
MHTRSTPSQKIEGLSLFTALALFAAIAVTVQTQAQMATTSNAQNTGTGRYHHHYVAIDLGTLGGPNAAGCVPNCRDLTNRGAVLFGANTPAPDPYASNPSDVFNDGNLIKGVYRQSGFSLVLEAAQPGYNSFPNWATDTGLVAGVSENGQIDPMTTFPEVDATAWLLGFPINIGTLGGTSSAALAANDSQQVVGGAANQTADPFAGPFFHLTPNPNNPNLNFGLYFPSLWWPIATETHAFL